MLQLTLQNEMTASPSSRRAWVEIDADTSWHSNSNVALLAEGVGRNLITAVWTISAAVALLAEGVGRNLVTLFEILQIIQSPSSRRAWVEIRPRGGRRGPCPSPSSRRAWVEIFVLLALVLSAVVALLAEGVGRNWLPITLLAEMLGRPPRGGRG